MEKVNLADKFDLFQEHWTPKLVGELNDQYVKLAKVQGKFVWHDHREEDELFLVLKGTLKLHFRDRPTVTLHPGELYIVPRGVEHCPEADEEVHLMLLEPKSTAHTGDVESDRTVTDLEWI